MPEQQLRIQPGLDEPDCRSTRVASVSNAAGGVSSGFDLLAPRRFGQRIQQRIELALEDAVEVVQRQADPVVGDAVLAEVVRAALAAALTRADLYST